MARPFRRGWKYLMAKTDSVIEERADPKVQLQQAIEDAQKQHETLTAQAASVIGNHRQLEMRLHRAAEHTGRLRTSAGQALVLADRARAANDSAQAASYEAAAEAFATQLVEAERSESSLRALHGQSAAAAGQARSAVEQNAQLLRQRMAERNRLMTQLEQARMQEQVAKSLSRVSELAAPGDTPTLEQVRDKIETRYAKALGQTELARGSVESQMLQVQQSAAAMEGKARLEEIRASLAAGSGAAGAVAAAPADAVLPAESNPVELPMPRESADPPVAG